MEESNDEINLIYNAMRMIQKDDIVFHYLTVDEARTVKNYNDFACFRWDGLDWLSFCMYAENYYNAAFQLLEDTKSNGHVDVYQPCQNIDSIIYPICFLYRQFVELTLKWLFLKYASLDDTKKKAYLKRANHNLIQCWDELKLVMKEKLSKVDCDCDIAAIEHYVKEWDTFDSEAYRLRYPCSIKVESSSIAGLRLDVITLKEKMKSFHDTISYIDGKIENIMHDYFGNCPEKSKFWHMYQATREKIMSFIARLELSDEQNVIPHPLISYLSSNEAEECIHLFFNGLSSDEKIVVETIYMVSSSSNNWPKGKNSAQQAFLYACVSRMQKEGFVFGEPVDETNLSFNNKNKRVLLNSLNKALTLLDKQ